MSKFLFVCVFVCFFVLFCFFPNELLFVTVFCFCFCVLFCFVLFFPRNSERSSFRKVIFPNIRNNDISENDLLE